MLLFRPLLFSVFIQTPSTVSLQKNNADSLTDTRFSLIKRLPVIKQSCSKILFYVTNILFQQNIFLFFTIAKLFQLMLLYFARNISRNILKI